MVSLLQISKLYGSKHILETQSLLVVLNTCPQSFFTVWGSQKSLFFSEAWISLDLGGIS